MFVKHPGGQGMQSKPAILIDNRVACIGPPLKTDHDIGLLRQQIGNFPFALIAPVGTNDCFYHRDSSSQKKNTSLTYFQRKQCISNTTHYNPRFFKMQGGENKISFFCKNLSQNLGSFSLHSQFTLLK